MRKLIIIATIVIVSRTPSYANLSLEAPTNRPFNFHD